MAQKKAGSLKLTDVVLVTSASLTADVSGVLPVANGGTGTGTFTDGQLLIGNTTGNTLAKATLTGTANRVTVTNGAGSITLSGPQDIHTGASPTFNALTLSTALPVASGGTAQTTALAARGSSGLNVESATAHGNSDYTIVAADRYVYTSAAFTAARTWTLPAANAVNAGGRVVVSDLQGTVTVTNTLIIARAGSDTVNGATSIALTVANSYCVLVSDGASKWDAHIVGIRNTNDVALAGAGGYLSLTNQVLTANPINLTSDVTSILTSANGGTGNGFAKFAGPASTEKTFILPNASCTILTSNAAVTEAQGGTNQTTYATGDTLYSSASNTLSKLAGNTTTTKKFLRQTGNGSVSAAPAWDTIAAADVPVFVASGGSHAAGVVPDPGATAGTNRYLREDATWVELVPAGTVVPFSGVTLPTGYLDCDGAAVSRTTYAALFAALSITQSGARTNTSPVVTGLSDTANMKAGFYVSGTGIPAGAKILTVDSSSQVTLTANATSTTTGNVVVAPWGIGDGSTTFNTPDLRGRAAVGSGTGSGLTARTVGQTAGEETHAQTAGEMPSHTHTYNQGINAGLTGTVTGGGAGYFYTTSSTASGSAGSGTAFNVMQPYGVVRFCVKT